MKKLNEGKLPAGTRVLTTDSRATKLVPGEIVGPHSRNGRESESYYVVKLETGEEEILKHSNKARYGSFEVVQYESRRVKKSFKDLTVKQKQQVIEHAIRLEVRKQLKESKYPGIDRIIKSIEKQMSQLSMRLESGENTRTPEQIMMKLREANELILDCF